MFSLNNNSAKRFFNKNQEHFGETQCGYFLKVLASKCSFFFFFKFPMEHSYLLAANWGYNIFYYYSWHCAKNEVSIKDFFSKCDQIHSFLRIWPRLLKKSLMGKLHFLCSVRSKLYTNWTSVFRSFFCK